MRLIIYATIFEFIDYLLVSFYIKLNNFKLIMSKKAKNCLTIILDGKASINS